MRIMSTRPLKIIALSGLNASFVPTDDPCVLRGPAALRELAWSMPAYNLCAGFGALTPIILAAPDLVSIAPGRPGGCGEPARGRRPGPDERLPRQLAKAERPSWQPGRGTQKKTARPMSQRHAAGDLKRKAPIARLFQRPARPCHLRSLCLCRGNRPPLLAPLQQWP